LHDTQKLVAVDCGAPRNEFFVNDSSDVEENYQLRLDARFLESNLLLPG
jgi:hypothetical protein